MFGTVKFSFLFFLSIEKPQKIDVFEDYLYIKLYDQSIIKMNKFGNGNGTFLINGYRSSDIGILHPLKQNRNSKCFRCITPKLTNFYDEFK